MKGVNVSVISLQGDDCRLECLGILSENTGGRIDIVNPLTITQEFSNILSNDLIATNSQVVFMLHKSLFVREEGGQEKKQQSNQGQMYRVVRDVGNVTKETELTYEYGVREGGELAENVGLPFQVQITYTKLDGAKYIRVISKKFQTTTDRNKAELAANVEVLSTHSAQVGAQLAKDGNYTDARKANIVNMKLLSRAAGSDERKQKQVSSWVGYSEKLDERMRTEQEEEQKQHLNLSDDEDDAPSDTKKEKLERKKAVRKGNRNDVTSNAMYSAKSANRSMWNK